MIRGEFFDYDPVTGLTEYYEETPDGKIHIHTYQDVEPILEHSKALAREGIADEAWKKNDFAVYAVLPPIVLGMMAKKGIKFLDPNAIGDVLREINQNFEYCKTTSKHHMVRT